LIAAATVLLVTTLFAVAAIFAQFIGTFNRNEALTEPIYPEQTHQRKPANLFPATTKLTTDAIKTYSSQANAEKQLTAIKQVHRSNQADTKVVRHQPRARLGTSSRNLGRSRHVLDKCKHVFRKLLNQL